MQVLREHRGHLACSLGLMVSKVFLEGARVTTVFVGGVGRVVYTLEPLSVPIREGRRFSRGLRQSVLASGTCTLGVGPSRGTGGEGVILGPLGRLFLHPHQSPLRRERPCSLIARATPQSFGCLCSL